MGTGVRAMLGNKHQIGEVKTRPNNRSYREVKNLARFSANVWVERVKDNRRKRYMDRRGHTK